ncbi:methylated-DNA--[protein]-cysteine S-methyltransferase [Polynucleobacter sp. AM-25C3]|jgi:methylated-DNA-[protein]-cysteine S-methyltransferase|uniref:methylated-DNA--[protein]-cysteine S-methyltransferase n=1 Tax=Polynucleobacter sp. AM-25C3 TaxID=1855569 RepID=UPI001C0E124F|nr:methylated-DNA--[protein]-cysteine S-methyltransferase [Polynucleobacter sp. AM-25C3]MBU3601637.1 methylated-DNA--[protein]-cysteine S-methyltransferase [Polynucleobacter sp. AM-25C3]
MPTSKSSEYCVISAPFGRLGVQTELVDGSLMISKIEYLPLNTPLSPSGNSLAKAFTKQCNQYFNNAEFVFDLPLKPAGTAHQRKVWNATQGIGVGKTSTYGEIAKAIKSGPRAVGTACGANPYPLVTPCHRVVSAQGLGGFMKEDSPGFYRQIKIWLLKHEGAL